YESDQVGLFLWGRLPQQAASCEDFVEEILNNTHVFLTPGFIFGSNGDRYIRISLCATEGRLQEAAERIRQYIRQKQS
ncbi:MAG: aminotransferase class I/II-fold pyridoxal phosphate-dependent enzyme, partial [Bacteroidales bacterium]|nr:aminotransferase class I/II-fold pyridoxal phosphate-dependent enzyme [Bacteroidales bacterium]